MRAHKAHVRPEGPVGAWRASHAMLWFLEVLRWSPAGLIFHERPSVTLSPRRVFCSPFSVLCSPGRVSAPCPICPIGPTASCYGTSQTCRGCRGKWKFGSLDAWKFGSAQRLARRALARVLFSVLRSPFSGARLCAPPPAGVWGSAPYLPISQSANQPGALMERPRLRGENLQRSQAKRRERRPGLRASGGGMGWALRSA